MKKFMRKFSSHEEFENEKDFEYPYVVWDGEHIHYGKKPKDEETDEPETPEDPTDEPEVPETPEEPTGYFEYSDGTKVPFEFPSDVSSNDVKTIDKDRVISIKFSDNVDAIYLFAFDSFSNLETVILNDDVTRIMGYSFADTKVSKVVYKDVEYTDFNTLKGVLEENNVSMADNAFDNTPIYSTYEPEVPETPEDATGYFEYADGTKVPFEFSRLTVTGGNDFKTIDKGNVVSVKLSDNVEKINVFTFDSFSNLETVILNDNINEIMRYSFADTKVNKVIYKNVEYTNLNTLKGVLEENNVSMEDKAFDNTPIYSTYEPEVPETPEEPEEIDYTPNQTVVKYLNGFYNVFDDLVNFYEINDVSNVSEIIVGNTVEHIGPFNGTLSKLNKLTFADLDASVPLRIHENTFERCTELKEVIFPSNLKTLDISSFENSGLERVEFTGTLPVQLMSNSLSCPNLTSIIFGGNIETWNYGIVEYGDEDWKEGIPETCIIHCSDGDININ